MRAHDLIVGAKPEPTALGGRDAERSGEVRDLCVGLEQDPIGRLAADRVDRLVPTREPAALGHEPPIDDTFFIAGDERIEDQRDAANPGDERGGEDVAVRPEADDHEVERRTHALNQHRRRSDEQRSVASNPDNGGAGSFEAFREDRIA